MSCGVQSSQLIDFSKVAGFFFPLDKFASRKTLIDNDIVIWWINQFIVFRQFNTPEPPVKFLYYISHIHMSKADCIDNCRTREKKENDKQRLSFF